jgi:glycosyltransferase involved in cell wall biosynthesis
MNYIIITPAKDEAEYIEHTLRSVCAQTVRPERWLIVNDGSSDNTAAIVGRYQKKHSWINLIENETKLEKRLSGSKVIRAFYRGYNTLANHDYDFIVKLDADLVLPENYFEKVATAFRENQIIGLCGGYCATKQNGRVVKDRTAKDHIRGAIKAYRRQCFEDIGGIKPVLGWDGIDEMSAMYLGWQIKQLPLQVIHLRATRKEYKPLQHRFHAGMAYYRTGYGLCVTLLKSSFWAMRRPYVLGGVVFLAGFIAAFVRAEKQIGDKDLRRFFRKFKYNRMLQFLHLK